MHGYLPERLQKKHLKPGVHYDHDFSLDAQVSLPVHPSPVASPEKKNSKSEWLLTRQWTPSRLLGIQKLDHDADTLEASLFNSRIKMLNQILARKSQVKDGTLLAFPGDI